MGDKSVYFQGIARCDEIAANNRIGVLFCTENLNFQWKIVQTFL